MLVGAVTMKPLEAGPFRIICRSIGTRSCKSGMQGLAGQLWRTCGPR